jgi:hypothetical protein
MQKLTFPPSLYAQRGDILVATSGSHKGDYYMFLRTASGPDKDMLGNDLPGIMRHSFNLFNLNNGKARQSEIDRLFVSKLDGVNEFIKIADLEQHFGFGLSVVTDELTIAPKVKAAVDTERAAERSQELSELIADFLRMITDAPKVQMHYVM